jgi:PPOX class probable F420-dependent enzyme
MTDATNPALGDALCLSLRTFRKDGTFVDTPVWVVEVDGKFCMYTDGRSYKAKRLRRNPRVEVAACDVWGKLLGPRYAGVCGFVEEPEKKARIFKLIRKKYHIHSIMSDIGSRLTGKVKHRVVLEIELQPGA